MKIVAPISRAYEVDDLIKAGADELYCGVYTKEWRKKYTDMAAPNRHPGRSASLGSYKELERVIGPAHSRGVPVLLAINESYSCGQYELALDNASRAIDAGVDALIISDINLMMMVREKWHNIRIHAGTGAATFNSHTAAFYKDLGASRVILDRQLTIEEIGFIASKASGVELEVFVLNQKCHNIDGFCTFAHGLTGVKHPILSGFWNIKLLKWALNMCPVDISAIGKIILKKELGCCLDYEIYNNGNRVKAAKESEFFGFFDVAAFLKRCGACALYDLDRLKVGFVKIVGREDFTAKKARDIRFIRSSIEKLKEDSGKKNFTENIKALYKNFHHSDCGSKFCYYLN
jgi:hypothetical protein